MKTILAAVTILSGLLASTLFAADYKLRGNDVIHVKVFQEEDLSLKTRISKDGFTSLPLIGTLKLDGLTVNEAAVKIRNAYADGFLVNPQVNVAVESATKRTFTVLGPVGKAGVYEIPDYKTISLVEAIGMAGGFSEKANQRKVTVKRRVRGKVITRTFNVKNMAKLSKAKQIAILEHDVISVAESVF